MGLKKIIMAFQIKKRADADHGSRASFIRNISDSFFSSLNLGTLERIQFHIESGFDVNHTSHEGLTPLKIAARAGRLEVVELLIRNGANINFVNNDGSVIFDAIHSKNTDLIAFLLFETMNFDEIFVNGSTPLILSSQLKLYEIVDLLVVLGANTSIIDFNGKTAIDYGDDKIRKLLSKS